MTIRQIEDNYKKYYELISFERTGLFRCIKSVFNTHSVLYLGSSIHITPSFVFSNAVYVDKSDFSDHFFSNSNNVVEFINRKKEYARYPKIKYINTDYQTMKINNSSNLVLSLFSLNSLNASLNCLNKNGVLIYLPLPSDKEIFNGDYSIKNIGYISVKKNKYEFIEGKIKTPRKPQTKYMVDDKFIDKNMYEVYLKE